jgi:anti-sigma regulatory factor (Ser/Thr protein kinase)
LRTAGPPATSVTQRLDDAALLTLYTDGLIEATRDALAGEILLREAIASDAVFFVESPAEFLETYCLRQQAPDDVAILVLNFIHAHRWTFEPGDWHTARRARREFVACLEAAGAAQSDIKAAELIFGELTANVAQHAAGPIDIALDLTAKNPVLHVIDRGEGYAPSERKEPVDLLTERGRGLWLVGRLGAQLSVEILPGFGTHVRAVLPMSS